MGCAGTAGRTATRQQRNSRRGAERTAVANQPQRIGFLRIGAPLVPSSIRASSEARVAEYVQDLFAHSRSGLRHETRLEAWNAQATLHKCRLQFRHGERSYVALSAWPGLPQAFGGGRMEGAARSVRARRVGQLLIAAGWPSPLHCAKRASLRTPARRLPLDGLSSRPAAQPVQRVRQRALAHQAQGGRLSCAHPRGDSSRRVRSGGRASI